MFPVNLKSNRFLSIFNVFVISAHTYVLGKGDVFLKKENFSSLFFVNICQNAQCII